MKDVKLRNKPQDSPQTHEAMSLDKPDATLHATVQMRTSMEPECGTMGEPPSHGCMNATHDGTGKTPEQDGTLPGAALPLASSTAWATEGSGDAALDIHQVMETITRISERTSLITLKDTTQTAGAGKTDIDIAAFAEEIKTLAGQTAEATREIKEQIDNVQSSAMQNLSHIENISGVITDITGIILTLTKAVEEQSNAAKGITTIAAMASRAIEEMNARITESSRAIDEIARRAEENY